MENPMCIQRARLSAQVMKTLEKDAMLSLQAISFEDEHVQRYLSSRLVVEQGIVFNDGEGLKTPRLYLLELLLGHYPFPVEDVDDRELFIALLNVTSALSGGGCPNQPTAMDLNIASEFFSIIGNQTSLRNVPNYAHVFELLREIYQYITTLYIEQEVDTLEQQLKEREEKGELTGYDVVNRILDKCEAQEVHHFSVDTF